jgi:glycosyltransferase involved in cell wall biosynthesis
MNKKYKVIIVTPYYPPKIGGVENYTYNIAKGLKNSFNWEVIIITSDPVKKKEQMEIVDGIKIYRLPIWFKISNTPINPLWYFRIRNIIKEERPDIVNAHSPVPFFADVAALAVSSVPFVLTYHSGTMKKKKFLLDVFITFYEKFILAHTISKANIIICSSSFVRNSMMSPYLKKTLVIYPGVNTDIFKPKASNKFQNNTVLFICRYANMHRMKGLDYLFEAMAMVPYANLKIIGEVGGIKGNNVIYLGVKTGKDLVREIQNSSVLVLPSLAHMESFGMVLLEAMACKIPVIGTDIGGISEVINNEIDGFLVPPESSIELANAINNILTNKKLARDMGEAGYKKVHEKYMWDSRVKLTNEVLLSCL